MESKISVNTDHPKVQFLDNGTCIIPEPTRSMIYLVHERVTKNLIKYIDFIDELNIIHHEESKQFEIFILKLNNEIYRYEVSNIVRQTLLDTDIQSYFRRG